MVDSPRRFLAVSKNVSTLRARYASALYAIVKASLVARTILSVLT
jgi:hypothetical protein